MIKKYYKNLFKKIKGLKLNIMSFNIFPDKLINQENFKINKSFSYKIYQIRSYFRDIISNHDNYEEYPLIILNNNEYNIVNLKKYDKSQIIGSEK